jgi:hypothetical protein
MSKVNFIMHVYEWIYCEVHFIMHVYECIDCVMEICHSEYLHNSLFIKYFLKFFVIIKFTYIIVIIVIINNYNYF